MTSLYKPLEDIDPAVRVTLMMLKDDLVAAGYKEVSASIRFKDGDNHRLVCIIDGEWMVNK